MEYKILLVDQRQEVVEPIQNYDWSEDFSIEICSSLREALAYVKEHPVHLLYLPNELDGVDGIQLMHQFKQILTARYIPIMMLSDEKDHSRRINHIIEGLDDYIILPFDIHELEIRTRIILQEIFQIFSFNKQSAKGFSGSLSEMNLLDLLQTLELGKKSAIIHLQRNLSEGRVFVREGMVYDAEVRSRQSEDALFFLFTWTDGYFYIEFSPIERDQKIRLSTQELFAKGTEILEQWEKLRAEFPNLGIIPQLKETVKKEELGSEILSIIPLIDGHKNLRQVLETSPVDEIKTMSAVHYLKQRGMVEEITPELGLQLQFEQDTEGNDEIQVEHGQMNNVISMFISGIMEKTGPSERIRKLYPQFNDQKFTENGAKQKSSIQFSRVELQYLKQKLL